MRAQIEHGLDEAGYGYWGFSPSSDPAGGYREFGVDALGHEPGRLLLRRGVDRTRPRVRRLPPGHQPEADLRRRRGHPARVFLALPYAKDAGAANLAKLRANFDAYGDGGFYDAVAVRSGTVARTYLALDQSMVHGPIGNVLTGDLHRAFGSYRAERAATAPDDRSGGVLRARLIRNIPRRRSGFGLVAPAASAATRRRGTVTP